MNIYQKLNAARRQFHSLELKKSGQNKFAGYNYFELADFLVPALRIFDEVGLCAIVSFQKDQADMTIVDVEIGIGPPDGAIVINSPLGSASLKGCHEVQNIGAVETYQRRYLWMSALEIVEHDALDAVTGNDTNARKDESMKISAVKESAKSLDLTDERRNELDEASQYIIEQFAEGKEAAVMRIVRQYGENDEKIYLADRLGAHSKVRSFIKEQLRLEREAAKVKT